MHRQSTANDMLKGINAFSSSSLKFQLSLRTPFVERPLINEFEKDAKLNGDLRAFFKIRKGKSKIWRRQLCKTDFEKRRMYYLDGESGKPRHRAEIHFKSIRSIFKALEENRDFCFKIETDGAMYLFSAQSEEEMTTWVNSIKEYIGDSTHGMGENVSRRHSDHDSEKNVNTHLVLAEDKLERPTLSNLASTPTCVYVHEKMLVESPVLNNMFDYPTGKLDASKLQIQNCDLKTPDNWVERHPALHRCTGAHPLNAEPLNHYFDFTIPTPKEIAFVRNHGPTPRIEIQEWDLTIVSAVGEKFTFTLEDLKRMRSEKVMATCICAGIRRMEFNVAKMTKGSNYGTGVWHTGMFEGVMLRDVFTLCGIERTRGKFEWVETEGHEDLPKGKYTTCIPLERVLDYSQDVMLAYLHNGAPLMPDHGFPVRLIVPGIFGGRWTKCIRKIRILDHESTHFYHLHDNRVLPPYINENCPNLNEWFENNLYTYWYHPVNSYIAEPRHGSVLALAGGGILPIKGVAYTGNGIQITRVELSLDGAKTWRPCKVTYTTEPRHGFKYWDTFFWEPQEPITTMEIFTQKVDELIVRAFDQNLNTQPVHPTWNLLGFANNCLYRVKLATRVSNNGPAYQFIHPVSQCSKTEDCTGWISIQRNREKKKWLAPPKNKKYLPPIPLAEVRKHDKRDDAWFVIDGVVYDVTQYIKDNKHPGGNAALLPFLGLDCSEAFHAVGHSPAAQPDLDACAIGMTGLIRGRDLLKQTNSNVPAVARKSIELPFKLTHKEVVNDCKTLIKIKLLGPSGTGYITDEPIGGHFSIINKNVRRSYTPVGIKKLGDRVEMELSIKVYEDGELTPWIDEQEIGDTFVMAGPKGHIHYAVEKIGYFSIAGQTARRYKKVTMIAGGTGITPMLQILRYVYEHTKDNKERTDLHDFKLIYSIRTRDEIIELGELKKYASGFVTLNLHITKEKGKRVDMETIEEVCGRGTDDSLALICGPPLFCEAMYTYLSHLNYGSIVTY